MIGLSTVGTLVVVESGAALLGLDLFEALQMKLTGRNVVATVTLLFNVNLLSHSLHQQRLLWYQFRK